VGADVDEVQGIAGDQNEEELVGPRHALFDLTFDH
jgi:hypothetical protein